MFGKYVVDQNGRVLAAIYGKMSKNRLYIPLGGSCLGSIRRTTLVLFVRIYTMRGGGRIG